MYMQQLNPSNNKNFWKAIKYLSKKNSPPTVLSWNRVDASTSAEKAAMLNTFLANASIIPYLPLTFQI